MNKTPFAPGGPAPSLTHEAVAASRDRDWFETDVHRVILCNDVEPAPQHPKAKLTTGTVLVLIAQQIQRIVSTLGAAAMQQRVAGAAILW